MLSNQEMETKYANLDFDWFGLEIGQGWHQLTFEALKELNEISSPDNKLNIVQCKEKFGYWNLYVWNIQENNNKTVETILHKYTKKANSTCEYCGSTEDVNTGRNSNWWIKTLCKPCHKKGTTSEIHM